MEQRMVAGDWTVFPAIDLRRGRVVRLLQGDPDLETEYASDPLDIARRWQKGGADWVHVVNLDGAFGEQSARNLAALERIVTGTTGLQVQFGGGLRDVMSVRRALNLGVSRAVLGTAAVENPALVDAVLEDFGPERIAVGIDARGGKVQTHGWQEASSVTAVALGRKWAARGIRWVIFTDVARDGMGTGINLAATSQLARINGLNVIASGGVASLDDVRRTQEAGVSGVIIGRALYEGQLALEDALHLGRAG